MAAVMSGVYLQDTVLPFTLHLKILNTFLSSYNGFVKQNTILGNDNMSTLRVYANKLICIFILDYYDHITGLPRFLIYVPIWS